MKVSMIFLFATCFIAYSCNNGMKTDYYFSDNFSGEVAVIYDCGSSNDPIYKEGRLQLYIPESGILYTKAQLPHGKSLSRFFIRRKGEAFDTIDRYLDQRDTNIKKKHIFFERVMSDSCGDSKKTYNGIFFNVGFHLDLDSVRSVFERHVFDELCEHGCK